MHNFVYLAQRRSHEFSCEPNFGGVPPWLRQWAQLRTRWAEEAVQMGKEARRSRNRDEGSYTLSQTTTDFLPRHITTWQEPQEDHNNFF